MIDCPKCGRQNAVTSNFCSHCGMQLHAGETTRVILSNEEDTRTIELSAEDAAAIRALPTGNALLVVTRGPDVGARFLLDADEVTAGRSPNSDIFLDDITVSRHHAKFVRHDGQFEVMDQHSHNGTYVNRTLVDQSAALRPGDEVQIGKYRMTFFVSEHGTR